MKKFFTTFKVAELCGVAHTTVIRWISEKKLKAHETPGGHRRIAYGDLLAFMNKFGVPIPDNFETKPVSVMAIDDEPAVLAMLKEAFRQISPKIQFSSFTSAVDALMAIGKNPPNLIIVDILMPGMDGIQMCIKLKTSKDASGVKIIAITGKELSEEEQRFLKQNTDLVMKKPLSPGELVSESKKLIGIDL